MSSFLQLACGLKCHKSSKRMSNQNQGSSEPGQRQFMARAASVVFNSKIPQSLTVYVFQFAQIQRVIVWQIVLQAFHHTHSDPKTKDGRGAAPAVRIGSRRSSAFRCSDSDGRPGPQSSARRRSSLTAHERPSCSGSSLPSSRPSGSGRPTRRSYRGCPPESPQRFRPRLGQHLFHACAGRHLQLRRPASGGGNAPRSTLPLGVNGRPSIRTKTAGTM